MVCRRHKSLQVCKSAVCKSAVGKSASLQVCKSASLQVCKSASLQVCSLQVSHTVEQNVAQRQLVFVVSLPFTQASLEATL